MQDFQVVETIVFPKLVFEKKWFYEFIIYL
jgi:hypothetical protein